MTDPATLQVILGLIAIFAGVINTFLAFLLYIVWGEIKSQRKKHSDAMDSVYKLIRENKAEVDERREKDLTEMRDKFEKLKLLIQKNN